MILKLTILALAISLRFSDPVYISQPDINKGKEIYKKRCLVCHQADGSGVSGMFPPLRGTPKVLGAPDSLISIVIFGMKGPTELNGVTYYQAMPAVNIQNDEDVASVLNYIRTNWGNKAKPVTPENVKKVRLQGNK
jgi:mono/diheme cytochrome c family protein